MATGATFFLKDGFSLTAYSFACGYIQWASLTGKEIDRYTNGKELCMEHAHYHIRHWKDGKRIAWETTSSLTEARKLYKKMKF